MPRSTRSNRSPRPSEIQPVRRTSRQRARDTGPGSAALHQLGQAFPYLAAFVPVQVGADTLQGLGKAFVIERLQQVIQRLGLETLSAQSDRER
jgi:hypothetical protein